MVARQKTALPIQTLIHVKDEQILQRDAARVYQCRKWLIPALGTAGDDCPRHQSSLIVALDDRGKFFRHERTKNRGIGDLPVWDAQIGAKR
jgi:hypothetical protein